MSSDVIVGTENGEFEIQLRHIKDKSAVVWSYSVKTVIRGEKIEKHKEGTLSLDEINLLMGRRDRNMRYIVATRKIENKQGELATKIKLKLCYPDLFDVLNKYGVEKQVSDVLYDGLYCGGSMFL